MILGSDRRYGDKEAGIQPRSDTIILVRLDPDKEVIAMTSIPRDLLVDIPGVGNQVKINEAYENFGERGAVRAVKKLLSIDGEAVPDQPRGHGRLRRLPRARSTTSAASTPTSTATTSTTRAAPAATR